MKFGQVVFEICRQTDVHTYRHIVMLITVLCTGGELNSIKIQHWYQCHCMVLSSWRGCCKSSL